jgi:flagellar protein FlaG
MGLAMLDVTSTNKPGAISTVRRADSAAAGPAPAAGGQDAPVRGTNLPVESPSKPELVELPELERLAENIADFVKSRNRDLTFSVHEASGHTVVRVLDGETKEVIRQIPSEEFLRMSEALADGSFALLDTEA